MLQQRPMCTCTWIAIPQAIPPGGGRIAARIASLPGKKTRQRGWLADGRDRALGFQYAQQLQSQDNVTLSRRVATAASNMTFWDDDHITT